MRHYTVFERLQSIVAEGMINTADTRVSRKVKRVVWFSTNACWEKTVVKIVLNNHGRSTGICSCHNEE